MPRTGSSWLDRVCRVPKATSFSTVARMRVSSISRRIARRAGLTMSGGRPEVGAPSMGAAARAAEAERNARRSAMHRSLSMPVGVEVAQHGQDPAVIAAGLRQVEFGEDRGHVFLHAALGQVQ